MREKNLFEFFRNVGRLKETKRMGWAFFGVENGESVAEHSFRLAVMAMVFAKEFGLDELKCLKLALVHDLPESFAGDTVTRHREQDQKISNKKKFEKEKNGLLELVKGLGKKDAKEIKSLWFEFEEGKTKEARLVKQLDRLELALQALEYEKARRFKKLPDEFFVYTRERVSDKNLLKLYEEILKQRKTSRTA
jgi:putative hydrolase of HD superfamily